MSNRPWIPSRVLFVLGTALFFLKVSLEVFGVFHSSLHVPVSLYTLEHIYETYGGRVKVPAPSSPPVVPGSVSTVSLLLGLARGFGQDPALRISLHPVHAVNRPSADSVLLSVLHLRVLFLG